MQDEQTEPKVDPTAPMGVPRGPVEMHTPGPIKGKQLLVMVGAYSRSGNYGGNHNRSHPERDRDHL